MFKPEMATAQAYSNYSRPTTHREPRICVVSVPTQESTIDRIANRYNDYGSNYRPMIAIKISPLSYVVIGFAKGNIDNYAVFIHCYKLIGNHYIRTEAPWMRDFQLLGKFQKVANQYNMKEQVLHDFINVFEHTGHNCNPQKDWVFNHLDDLSSHYSINSAMCIYFVVLHLSMISECKYKRSGHWGHKKSILGKRIKFIGFYQAIVKGWNSHQVANFSKHVNHNYLLNLYNTYREQFDVLAEKSPIQYEYVY